MKLEWKKRIKREVAVARKKIEEAMVERRVQVCCVGARGVGGQLHAAYGGALIIPGVGSCRTPRRMGRI